jgi:hypothetical protein
MLTDSYFVIGTAHASAGDPCQDYAMHGADFGIVADGCSSSLGRPDIGARLAAIALLRAFRQAGPIEAALLAGLRGTLSIVSREDLLTTVGGFVSREDGIDAWLWGDGVMFAEYHDGTTELRVVQWIDNTPMYPIYLLDPDVPELVGTVNGTLLSGAAFHWRPGRVRNFLIATDGMLQLAGVTPEEALTAFTAFKTTEGAFLKRRAMRALKTITPIDDLAMVAFHEALR